MELLLQILLVIAIAFVALWAFARLALGGEDLRRWDEPAGDLASRSDRPSAENAEVLRLLDEFHQQIKAVPPRQRLGTIRRLIDAGFAGASPEGEELGVERRPVDADGVPGEWVLAPASDPDRRMLYIHGGAFLMGSPDSHRGLTAALAKAAGISLLVIDYRLMPEYRRIDSVIDCRNAYRWMLANGPQGAGEPEDVYIAGDSAGGNLTLALTAWIRDEGLRQADAAVALSPATDTTVTSPSMRDNVATDRMLGPGLGILTRRLPNWAGRYLMLYLGRMRPQNPVISPIFGDLSNLPPTLVQASTTEMLVDDCRRYVNKARAQGSPVELQLWPDMVHVWQIFERILPEGREAIEHIAAFLAKHSNRRKDAAAA